MEQRTIEEELRDKIYYLEERIETLEARMEKFQRNVGVSR
jgi:chaperonin cofactor prefoldin